MGLKCGIVGLPNVGKSTIFNALTKAGIAAENYPFCTIEPNVGIVEVPDQRLQQLADIVHVAGHVNPTEDIEVINTELALADLATVEKLLNKYSKQARQGGDKEALKLVTVLEKILPVLNEGKPARQVALTKEEKAIIKPLCLLTVKPTMYVANVDDSGFDNNPLLQAVENFAAKENAPVVALCAKIESEIAELDEEDKKLFLEDMGMHEAGLDRVIRAGYNLLGLQTYFTAGPKEVRAWTIHKGDTAPQAAGVIHTDFERGFIRAQTISFNDYIEHNGEKGAQEAGKMRAEGKDYVVQDGDVMNFLFNV